MQEYYQEGLNRNGQPPDKAARLNRLGLDQDVLTRAVAQAAMQVSGCTEHDPPNVPGILMWGKVVRYLRDLMTPRGWRSHNRRGYPTVVSPGNTVAISSASGDAATGLVDKKPSTRSPKGAETSRRVNENQISFIDTKPEAFGNLGSDTNEDHVNTWLLLHHIDEEAEQIRCELSLPSAMNETGHIDTWRDRIILDPVSFAWGAALDEDETTEELDIHVERRTEGQ